MFRSVSIHGFKGLNELKLGPLGQVNVIGGMNNVGKTSILEAIFLALDRLDPQMFIRLLSWRGVETITAGESMWLPFFTNEDSKGKIRISFESSRRKIQQVEYSNYHEGSTFALPISKSGNLDIRGTRVEGLHNIGTALLIKATADGKPVQDSLLKFSPGQFGLEHRRAAIPETKVARAFMTKFMANADEAETFTRVDSEGKADQVTDALRAVDSRVKEISIGVEGGAPRLLVKLDGMHRKFPLALLGDGARRIVSLVLAILDRPDSLILVDEIENGIHYSKQDVMWDAVFRAAQASGSQVIATTHSRECLLSARHASEPHDGALVYFRLQRRKNANDITVERYSSDEFIEAIDADLEVR